VATRPSPTGSLEKERELDKKEKGCPSAPQLFALELVIHSSFYRPYYSFVIYARKKGAASLFSFVGRAPFTPTRVWSP